MKEAASSLPTVGQIDLRLQRDNQQAVCVSWHQGWDQEKAPRGKILN